MPAFGRQSLLALCTNRWTIFSVASLLYVLSMFYRSSITVIAPDLMADLSLSVADLSLASAAFFYAYAFIQIPMGLVLDHAGPKKTMPGSYLLAFVGVLIFAWAESSSLLVLGRLLMGVGMACSLIGTFKILTIWFGPAHFATLSATVISVGSLGTLASTSPLVLSAQRVGWRSTFVLIAFSHLLLAGLLYLVMRGRPIGDGHAAPSREGGGNRLAQAVDVFRLIVRKRDFWLISAAGFLRYGIYGAVQSLWAGPYLINVMGCSPLVAGNILFLFNFALILGGPVSGYLSDKVLRTRKWIMVMALWGLSGSLFALAVLPVGSTVAVLATLFTLFGFFGSTGGVLYAHVKELMPLTMVATALTGMNFFVMLGAAIFIQGLGGMMQYLYPTASLSHAAFHAAFLVCALLLFLAGIGYVFTRESHAGRG
ncbi:MAG: putative sulfoacetate transporter SauU [Syntrophaceae bacterium PtaU1.Bin231]|nr:MAG: putative sulfoacetate transporter SauU [Syntrophaceae bacterium PtaU1.Bin231]